MQVPLFTKPRNEIELDNISGDGKNMDSYRNITVVMEHILNRATTLSIATGPTTSVTSLRALARRKLIPNMHRNKGKI